jgi:alkylation response protein AidB-like acyl-CoA dehydrogenase
MTKTAGLSPEMRDMMIEAMRQVCHRDMPEERLLELDARDEFPLEFIRTLLSPDVGLHLIFLPESVGGLGGGALDVCRVSEEMAVIDLGLATAFLAICLGTDPIIVGGTEEQKAKWLGRIAEGRIVAYGVTEPAAGSNVAALQTVAERVVDADGKVTGYRINGTKQFITNGGVAEIYTILAKAPEGPTFFVVERDTPGLSAGRHEDKHGIRASDTAGVILEDVGVPVDQLIGGVEGQGLKQANAVFGYTRLMVGAFGLGAGKAALHRAVRYAKERIQFGSPLIEKEGYCAKLIVPNWVALEAGRAYAEEIANRLDAGEEGLQVEGAVAKYWCTMAGNQAADDAIQALGGYGYAREYVVEKIKRDVRITTIYEGTNEIMQSIIGMFRWKETVRSKGDWYEGLAAELDALHAARGDLGADLVAAATRDLNAVIRFCHAKRTATRQSVQFTLADMMTACEVAGALCRRAAARDGADAADAEDLAAMSRLQARRVHAQVGRGAVACVAGPTALSDAETQDEIRDFAAGLATADSVTAQAGDLDDVTALTAYIKRQVG